MIWVVTNPTDRKKAVKIPGDLLTINERSTVEVEANWSEAQIQRYTSAGLEILGKAESDSTDLRLARLLEIVADFPDKTQTTHWTATGAPQVMPLNLALGEDEPKFTAEERDDLWAKRGQQG